MGNKQYIKNTPHHYCKYQKTGCFKNEHELNIVYFIALSILAVPSQIKFYEIITEHKKTFSQIHWVFF